MNKNDVTEIRDAIILALLPHVEFEGWVWACVERAAIQAGHTGAMARSVFPGRIKDVLDGFADMADREMMRALVGVKPDELRVRERIRVALLARYQWLLQHKEALRQSVQYWMVPTRKPRGAKIVWRTADRIWVFAGDESNDYNRYTKRALLSGIIVSTTLAWLNDSSQNMDNTKAFLDRRIENVMQLGKVIHKFKKAS